MDSGGVTLWGGGGMLAVAPNTKELLQQQQVTNSRELQTRQSGSACVRR